LIYHAVNRKKPVFCDCDRDLVAIADMTAGECKSLFIRTSSEEGNTRIFTSTTSNVGSAPFLLLKGRKHLTRLQIRDFEIMDCLRVRLLFGIQSRGIK
jgi:hypothetical protein